MLLSLTGTLVVVIASPLSTGALVDDEAMTTAAATVVPFTTTSSGVELMPLTSVAVVAQKVPRSRKRAITENFIVECDDDDDDQSSEEMIDRMTLRQLWWWPPTLSG